MLKFNFTPFPVLTTERLVLRQTEPGDVDEIFFLRSDSEVMKYIDRPVCTTKEEALAFIQRLANRAAANEALVWAITLKGDTKLVGNVGYWNTDPANHRAELGYALHPDHQHKGIMHEAIAAVLHYGFDTLKLHSVEANTNTANAISQRTLEKHGFVREALFRQNYYFNGKFLDSAIYCLLEPGSRPRL